MTPEKGQALMLLLGKGKSKAADSSDTSDAEGGDGNDDDMKMALGDLASAFGVSLKNPSKAVDAMKAIYKLWDSSESSGEMD